MVRVVVVAGLRLVCCIVVWVTVLPSMCATVAATEAQRSAETRVRVQCNGLQRHGFACSCFFVSLFLFCFLHVVPLLVVGFGAVHDHGV